MVRKFMFLLTIFCMSSNMAWSCDACGCSVSGGGLGLLSNYKNNTIGLKWYRSQLSSTNIVGSQPKDYFNVAELNIRFQIKPRWKISARLPYKWNYRIDSKGRLDISGLSDPTIMGHYTAIDQFNPESNSTLYWEVSAGIKLPTGKYDINIEDRDMPANFNIGFGSLGYLFQSSVFYKYRFIGLNGNISYQINGETKEGYRFGNEFTATLLAFGQLTPTQGLSFMPFAGLNKEYVDVNTYSNGNNAHGTGGDGLFFTAGMNTSFSNFNLGYSFAVPIKQHYSDGEVEAKSRFSIELSFNF